MILFSRAEDGRADYSVQNERDTAGIAREHGLTEQERKDLLSGKEVTTDNTDHNGSVAVTWSVWR